MGTFLPASLIISRKRGMVSKAVGSVREIVYRFALQWQPPVRGGRVPVAIVTRGNVVEYAWEMVAGECW